MNEEFDEIDATVDGPFDFVYTGHFPSTLQALCIFTFIGTLLLIIKDIYLISWISEGNEIANFVIEFMGINMERSSSNGAGLMYFIEIMSSFVCLTGAILLMNVKKNRVYHVHNRSGGYIFNIIRFFAVCLDYGASWFGIIMIVAYTCVPVAFIVMYSTFRRYLH
ncbi:MAG: hypothetical protein HRT57_01200 [Crocinitomicaceae bacterium]|nr:hypothetical protein [Crocinitomicaceae bacterium]